MTSIRKNDVWYTSESIELKKIVYTSFLILQKKYNNRVKKVSLDNLRLPSRHFRNFFIRNPVVFIYMFLYTMYIVTQNKISLWRLFWSVAFWKLENFKSLLHISYEISALTKYLVLSTAVLTLCRWWSSCYTILGNT